MGALGDPADVAAAVTFLSSQQARYITGDALTVDGGWRL
jgi:NAD(P)-dependent dehydrogenase (short-subunit alcohol dehydrogenase family)